MASNDEEWLSEAIVDYLKGPMYITPLMGFIDQQCMIFTPEDENKFEYTTAHEAFKALVDTLLTDFLGELGVTPEAFYGQVSKAQEADRLTTFVIQTILTVDDFLMFKAMMVKRNLDLTNQVLAMFESAAAAPPPAKVAAKLADKDESHLMDQAVELSKAMQATTDRTNNVKLAMRALQVEDEDDAMAVAIAASMREAAKADTELAEINQAIALSLAMDSERQRMLLEAETVALRAALAAKGGAFETQLAALRSELAAKGSQTDAELSALRAALAAKGFDAADAELAAIRAALAAKGASADEQVAQLKAALAKAGEGGKAADAQVAALTAALKASAADPAVAAARVADAKPKAVEVRGTAPSAMAALPPLVTRGVAPASTSSGGGAEDGARALKSLTSGKFVPAEIHGPTSSKVPSPEDPYASMGPPPSVMRSKAAGYKSTGETSGQVSLESIRAAAQAAAATQKNIAAAGGQSQQSWMDQQKIKLVAAKKAERDAEMEAYMTKVSNKERGWVGQPAAAAAAAAAGPTAASAETDAKRVALQQKLASKMLQDMMHKN